MIIRKQPDGQMILIAQTDHSRLVGQLAAHWGNERFATPRPYEAVARAAAFHDFGWLRYETNPLFDPTTGETPEFRQAPTTASQLESYRWCPDWLLGPNDPYASLIVSMHRTGLWRGRYGALKHPGHPARLNLPAAVQEFITDSEARQARERTAYDEHEVWTNYRLLQVWDQLGLYFCCQDPYQEFIEPVPVSYADAGGEGVRMILKPLGSRRVVFDSYPFDLCPLHVQLLCRVMPQSRYADAEAFHRAYFQAPVELADFELLAA